MDQDTENHPLHAGNDNLSPKHLPAMIFRSKARQLGISKSNGNRNGKLSFFDTLPKAQPKIAKTASCNSSPENKPCTISPPKSKAVCNVPANLRSYRSSSIKSRSASVSPVRSSTSVKQARPVWSSPSAYVSSPVPDKLRSRSVPSRRSTRTQQTSTKTTMRQASSSTQLSTMQRPMPKTINFSKSPAMAMKDVGYTRIFVDGDLSDRSRRSTLKTLHPSRLFSKQNRILSPDLSERMGDMDIESKVRTLIMFNQARRNLHTVKLDKSPKSVRWSPSVAFSTPPKTDPQLESPLQPAVQDIIHTASTLKKVDRLQFLELLDALRLIESDDEIRPKSRVQHQHKIKSLEKREGTHFKSTVDTSSASRSKVQRGEESNTSDRGNLVSSHKDHTIPLEHNKFKTRDHSLEQINQDRLFERMRLFQKSEAKTIHINPVGTKKSISTTPTFNASTAGSQRSSGLEIARINQIDADDYSLKSETRESITLVQASLKRRRKGHESSSDTGTVEDTAAANQTSRGNNSSLVSPQDAYGEAEDEFSGLGVSCKRFAHREASSVAPHIWNPQSKPFPWLQDSDFSTKRLISSRERSTMSAPDHPSERDHERERSSASIPEHPSEWKATYPFGYGSRSTTHSSQGYNPSGTQYPHDSEVLCNLRLHNEQWSNLRERLSSLPKSQLDNQSTSTSKGKDWQRQASLGSKNLSPEYCSENVHCVALDPLNAPFEVSNGDSIQRETEDVIEYFAKKVELTMNRAPMTVSRGQIMRDQSWKKLAELTLQPPVYRAEVGNEFEHQDPLCKAVDKLSRHTTDSKLGRGQNLDGSSWIDYSQYNETEQEGEQYCTAAEHGHSIGSANCTAPRFVPLGPLFYEQIYRPMAPELPPPYWAEPFEPHCSQYPNNWLPHFQPQPVYFLNPYQFIPPAAEHELGRANVPFPGAERTQKMREAAALPQVWASSLIDNFAQRYPMTGIARRHPSVPPGFESEKQNEIQRNVSLSPPNSTGRNAAAIQQQLELLLLRKKEKDAINKFQFLGKVAQPNGEADFERMLSRRNDSGSQEELYLEPPIAYRFPPPLGNYWM